MYKKHVQAKIFIQEKLVTEDSPISAVDGTAGGERSIQRLYPGVAKTSIICVLKQTHTYMCTVRSVFGASRNSWMP